MRFRRVQLAEATEMAKERICKGSCKHGSTTLSQVLSCMRINEKLKLDDFRFL